MSRAIPLFGIRDGGDFAWEVVIERDVKTRKQRRPAKRYAAKQAKRTKRKERR
jgi:hypothetical protein